MHDVKNAFSEAMIKPMEFVLVAMWVGMITGFGENTVLIITSDHGEEFGEHGIFDHGNSLYRPSVHVPLLIAFPSRVRAGKRFQEAISLRDLPATVIDLADLETETSFVGNSLARFWKDPPNAVHRRIAYFPRSVMRRTCPHGFL